MVTRATGAKVKGKYIPGMDGVGNLKRLSMRMRSRTMAIEVTKPGSPPHFHARSGGQPVNHSCVT